MLSRGGYDTFHAFYYTAFCEIVNTTPDNYRRPFGLR
jgi:hypothetical protein